MVIEMAMREVLKKEDLPRIENDFMVPPTNPSFYPIGALAVNVPPVLLTNAGTKKTMTILGIHD
jgi:hypothetical protein